MQAQRLHCCLLSARTFSTKRRRLTGDRLKATMIMRLFKNRVIGAVITHPVEAIPHTWCKFGAGRTVQAASVYLPVLRWLLLEA